MNKMPTYSAWDITEGVRDLAYHSVCPPMNRKERRTAQGKLLVAKGEAAALRAENEHLKQKLKNGSL